MRGLLVSAAHKSSGKTTVTLGLAAALRARGLTVQPFKKGPDYIDPLWLTAAAGRPCRNLDLYLSSPQEVAADFAAAAQSADVALVEGNKGLYDGLAVDGSNSNAAVARLLELPVLLVIDARGMTRGIAPLILGYQAFDHEIRIAGVVLNRLGGSRHESKLRAVIEHYTDVPVLGSLHESADLTIAERHLGLIPATEAETADERIARIARAVQQGVDLDRVLAVAAQVRLPAPVRSRPRAHPDVRIGFARDRAFGFYYAQDLEALQDAGAQLVAFDTLRDARLPAVDALFIGGGFPELFARELAQNATLRADIRAAIEAGLPVYAECGGLMYLARTLQTEGGRFPMVGALPLDVVMEPRPVGRGYMHLEETEHFPWCGGAGDGPRQIRAHEFHYSRVADADPSLRYAYRVRRGFGIDGARDGIVYRNVLASYAHRRAVEGDRWPERFVQFVRARGAAGRACAVGSARETELA
ncbi:MAG: cobyrinate a,c-diamide synthase [Burkholderiaceae bacterium]|nr:cobyrinate a,c-diamide synthase [Burkholderiaceae bacterium]